MNAAQADATHLALRLASAALLATVLLQWAAPAILQRLLPLFAAEISVLDSDFRLLGLQLDAPTLPASVRLRANLSRRLHVGRYTIHPFGERPHTEGWYQVELRALSALQGAALLLVVLAAWPTQWPREAAVRLLLYMPVAVPLILVDAPLQLLANLQWCAYGFLEPAHAPPLLVWARFMQGGGSLALTLVAAAGVLPVARHAAKSMGAKHAST